MSEDLIIPVDVNGFRCWCDTFRYQSWGEILVLSLFGSRNAVRSAWATLVDGSSSKKGRGATPTIKIGGVNARRAADPYSTINTPLGPEKTLHCILVNRRATRGGEADDHYLQVGPNADRRFFPRLSRLCRVPLRSSWSPVLWQLGQEADAIVEAEGHGLQVFKVSTEADVWHPIVRTALAEGKLS